MVIVGSLPLVLQLEHEYLEQQFAGPDIWGSVGGVAFFLSGFLVWDRRFLFGGPWPLKKL